MQGTPHHVVLEHFGRGARLLLCFGLLLDSSRFSTAPSLECGAAAMKAGPGRRAKRMEGAVKKDWH
jgi:hypothetical protein